MLLIYTADECASVFIFMFMSAHKTHQNVGQIPEMEHIHTALLQLLPIVSDLYAR